MTQPAVKKATTEKRNPRITESYHVDFSAHRLGEKHAKIEGVEARGVDGEVHVRIRTRGPSGFGAEEKSERENGSLKTMSSLGARHVQVLPSPAHSAGFTRAPPTA